MAARVLIIDDNPIARTLIRAILEENGHYVVAEADDAKSALSAYQAHKPDLVTLDLSLIQEDGLSVLKALKSNFKEARVLIISGNDQKKIKEKALQAGAIDLIAKPIESDLFLEAVRRASHD